MILDRETVIEHLQDKRLSYISKQTGINHFYLIRMRNGEVKNPRYDVLKKLSDYFQAYNKNDN